MSTLQREGEAERLSEQRRVMQLHMISACCHLRLLDVAGALSQAIGGIIFNGQRWRECLIR